MLFDYSILSCDSVIAHVVSVSYLALQNGYFALIGRIKIIESLFLLVVSVVRCKIKMVILYFNIAVFGCCL